MMETFFWPDGSIYWGEVISTVVLFALIGYPMYNFIKGFVSGYRGKNVK